MKIKIIVFVALLSVLFSQQSRQPEPVNVTRFGQMVYWRSLTRSEKAVFLDAWLFCTYELVDEIRKNPALRPIADQIEKQYGQPVYRIFTNLDTRRRQDLIDWIDILFRQPGYQSCPFQSVLLTAFGKLGPPAIPSGQSQTNLPDTGLYPNEPDSNDILTVE